jgi:hypothetical protein
MKNIVLVSALLFSGCMATPRVLMLNQPFSAKNATANIEIYSNSFPDKPFTEIAQISCDDTSEEYCLNQLKIKAREIGADAIILKDKKIKSSGITYVAPGNAVETSFESGMIGIAIRYK